MKRGLMILAIVALSAGCGQRANDSQPPPQMSEPAAAAPEATVAMTGKEAYEQVCAGCHEEGIDGAPKTGDREAWRGRSWLWEAVLFEHAKEGYEEMPARGGDASLDEATVEMAAEYMLTRTFPGVTRD